MITCFWDHKTKPSQFVVSENKTELYRWNYRDGYSIYQKLNSGRVSKIEGKHDTGHSGAKEHYPR